MSSLAGVAALQNQNALTNPASHSVLAAGNATALAGIPNGTALAGVPNAAALVGAPNAAALAGVPNATALASVPNATALTGVPNISAEQWQTACSAGIQQYVGKAVL